jgi:predicted HTH transcriptional regulator
MEKKKYRGIGLRGMKQLPEEGFPLPTFRMKAGMLEITFGRTKEHVAMQTGVQDIEGLSDIEKEILLFIQQQGALSKGEVVAKFGLNDKAVQRRLAGLVEKRLLVMAGSKKGAKYSVVKQS